MPPLSPRSTSRLYTGEPSNQGYACLNRSYNHMPMCICDKTQLHNNTYNCMFKHVILWDINLFHCQHPSCSKYNCIDQVLILPLYAWVNDARSIYLLLYLHPPDIVSQIKHSKGPSIQMIDISIYSQIHASTCMFQAKSTCFSMHVPIQSHMLQSHSSFQVFMCLPFSCNKFSFYTRSHSNLD